MTPKEKAHELVQNIQVEHNKEERYYTFHMSLESAKRAALIAVEFSKEFITGDLSEAFDKFLYIQDIKEEIEKL
jgi:hypothetical protein